MKAWQYRYLPLAERILGRIDTSGDCHLFMGALDGSGYGQVKDHGKRVSVTRWIWEYHHGPIPEGIHVLHHCDNPRCAKIEHLFLGTHTDNMRDKSDKGRCNMRMGENHPRSAVDLKQVRSIKKLLGDGIFQKEISRIIGVPMHIVSDISIGRTWSHIP